MKTDSQSESKKPTGAMRFFAIGVILFIQPQFLFAQSDTSSKEALARAIEECQKTPSAPVKSTAEIQNEVECTAAAVEMLTNNKPAYESPSLMITARDGLWNYQYLLAGAADTQNCKVNGPLVLPLGRELHIQLSSEDTIHELQIPSLKITITALPGRIEEIALQQNEVGDINAIAVTNIGASNMTSTPFVLRFVTETEYLKWEQEILRANGCGKE